MERPKLVFKSKEQAYFSVMNMVGDFLLDELYPEGEDKNARKELDKIEYNFNLQMSDKEPNSYEIIYTAKFINDGKVVSMRGEENFKHDSD